MKSTPIESILAQLQRVRKRQPCQWSACCPAHDDKSPSLSVRETADGAVLLHCFAGCTVAEITAVLGLEMADLFPRQVSKGRGVKRTPRLLSAGQALELLDHESNLIAIAAANVLRGVPLNQNDLFRINQAAGRINWLRNECIGDSYA
jgi:hypothetical protein